MPRLVKIAAKKCFRNKKMITLNLKNNLKNLNKIYTNLTRLKATTTHFLQKIMKKKKKLLQMKKISTLLKMLFL
jgi:hypothetical protein